MSIFSRKNGKQADKEYKNSTQEWLPIQTVKDGIVLLKDGRGIKLLEVLPVNFYLKSEVEQENIIYYFASYLKIAPDTMQIRVLTQRAEIEEYISRLAQFAESEENEACRDMIIDEMEYVRALSSNVAIQKRFFIVLEFSDKNFLGERQSFSDAVRVLEDEAYKAQRYLSQCGLETIPLTEDDALIDLLYSIINKQSSKTVKPGGVAYDIIDELKMEER